MRDADNAALHGVALKTIRRWRRDYQRRGKPRGQPHCTVACPLCDGAALDSPAYSELLGWYLGDGHIDLARRGVYSLHVVNDEKYAEDNARLLDLLRAVKPGSRPHTRRTTGCVITTVGWKHWVCLFPQHGPGRKHERPIVLEDWQRAIVEEHPGPFLRGLFHSDGCRVQNWAQRTVDGVATRRYYPRWQFPSPQPELARAERGEEIEEGRHTPERSDGVCDPSRNPPQRAECSARRLRGAGRRGRPR